MARGLNVGDRINNYEIIKVLGESNIATVYLAKDEIQFKKWILKEMDSPVRGADALQEFKENFINICRQLTSIKHKSFTRVIDYFIEGNRRFYIVREFLEGRSLQEFIETHDGDLSETQVKNWALQIFDIMEFLHEQNPAILMGVIVPKNLVLSPMGKIRIMDLGLARFFPLEKQKEILMKVSPGYTAPEILNMNHPPNARSDIYSLAAMLYFFFTKADPNKNPFGFKNISEFRPDLSETTKETIMKALDKKSRNRYASLKEFKKVFLEDLLKKQKTRLECSIEEIVADNAPAGKLIQGNFNIKNIGEGKMEGTIYSDFTWLKVHPDRFRSNEENVRFWIDTAYMEPGSDQKNNIVIQTSEERITIPVRVSIAPGYLRTLKTAPASLMLLSFPILFFLVLEGLRIFLLKTAWDILLNQHGDMLTIKSINFVLQNKQFLFEKTTFDPLMIFVNKVFGGLMLSIPIAIPMLVNRTREHFHPDVREKTLIPAGVAIILPVIFLILASIINFVPIEITKAPAIAYLNSGRYIISFILLSVMSGLYILAPRDIKYQNFIDRNKLIKISYFAIFVITFILSFYFLIVK